MTSPHKVAFPARCAVNISYEKHLCSQVFPAGIAVEGFFEGMVELFDADLKRKGFDGVALPAGSYELHKINGVRLDINKSLDELGVQDGDTLVLVPRVAGESFEPQYESLSTGLAAMGKWLGRDGGDPERHCADRRPLELRRGRGDALGHRQPATHRPDGTHRRDCDGEQSTALLDGEQ